MKDYHHGRSGPPRDSGNAAPPPVLGGQRNTGAYLQRRCEPVRTYFRCDRFFTVGREWFVMLRGGREIGPFASHDQAELALARFVARFSMGSPDRVALLTQHDERAPTSLEVLVGEFIGFWQQQGERTANSLFVWTQQRLDHVLQSDDVGAPARARALEYLLGQLDAELQ